MNASGPYDPGPSAGPPNNTSSTVAKVVGWILLGVGAMIALAGLLGGDGIGDRIGGLLIGGAIALIGAMLIWRFTSWKKAGPAAAVAVVLGALVLPAPAEKPVPTSGLVGSTTPPVATVTSSATVTVTASVSSSTPRSTATTTTTTPPAIATTTTTVAAPPNPGITETGTRTPVPTLDYTSPPRTTSEASGGGATYYRNCDEVRAAGAAPLRRGDPGYRLGLDREKDGIACEAD